MVSFESERFRGLTKFLILQTLNKSPLFTTPHTGSIIAHKREINQTIKEAINLDFVFSL